MNNIGNRIFSFLVSCADFVWENITKLFMWTFGFYLLPTFEYIGVTVVFILLELYTSIRKQQFLGEWKKKEVRRAKYFETFNKLILYTIGILATYVFQHHIAKDLIQIMYFFVAIISVRELATIVNNIESVTGIKIWSYLRKYVLQVLKINENNDKK